MTIRTAAVVFCVAAAAFVCACATCPDRSDDRAAIDRVLGQWRNALLAKDIDGVMALYSDRFQSNGRDKTAETEQMKEEIADSVAPGTMVIFEHATVTLEGDRATVVPIAISGRTGSGSMGLVLAKEDGRWRIVGTAD